MIYLGLGVLFCILSAITLIIDLKSEKGIRNKLDVIIDFILDPFTGFTSLFYVGVLLILVSFI